MIPFLTSYFLFIMPAPLLRIGSSCFHLEISVRLGFAHKRVFLFTWGMWWCDACFAQLYPSLYLEMEAELEIISHWLRPGPD